MEPWHYKPPQSLLCDMTYLTSSTWCTCPHQDSLWCSNGYCRVVMQTLCHETAQGCSKTCAEFPYRPFLVTSQTPVKRA